MLRNKINGLNLQISVSRTRTCMYFENFCEDNNYHGHNVLIIIIICRPSSFRCTPLLSNVIWCQYSTLLPYHLHSEKFEMATFSGKEKSNCTSFCKMALNSSQEPQYIKSAGNIINRPRPEPYATSINTRK